MHARPYVYATFGRWALQAALPVSNIRALKVKELVVKLLITMHNVEHFLCTYFHENIGHEGEKSYMLARIIFR